jgi:hypothetical protein
MNLSELEGEAKSIVEQAQGEMLTLAGLPIGTGQLHDQSLAVDSTCTSCGNPVQSTIKKQAILSIAKSTKAPAQLLCGNCMEVYLKDNLPYHDS